MNPIIEMCILFYCLYFCYLSAIDKMRGRLYNPKARSGFFAGTSKIVVKDRVVEPATFVAYRIAVFVKNNTSNLLTYNYVVYF